MKGEKVIHFRKIFYPFLAFLFGLALARPIFNADITAIVTVAVIFLVAMVLLLISKKFVILAILFIFVFLGIGSYFVGMIAYTGKDYKGENMIVARVSDDIKEYSFSKRIVLKDAYIDGERTKNISLYLKINDTTEVAAGDIITFVAEVKRVELFEGKSFKSYFLRDNVGYESEIKTSAVTVIGNKITYDEAFRMNIKSKLYENMSEDNAGICYAILFGDKSGVSDELYAYYRDAGVIHILTVSGLHIGFLVALIFFLLKACHAGRLTSTIITTVVLILYNLICGFAPAIVRASIMAIIILFAKLSGRQYDRLNAFGLAGFVILLINPLYAYDLGFLMSFFCVLTIFVLYPVLSKLLCRIMHDKLADGIALSITAEIGILPFIAEMSQKFNPLSFFVNLIVVPLFAIFYQFLFIAMIIIAIMPFLSKVLAIFDPFLSFISDILKFFAGTRVLIPLKPFPLPLAAGIYCLAFSCSEFLILNKRWRCITIAVPCLIVLIPVIIMLI